MKYLATFLCALFIVLMAVCSMVQASTSDNDYDYDLVNTLNMLFAVFFSINLIATIAFWCELMTPPLVAAYMLSQFALAAYGCFDLRSAMRHASVHEEEFSATA